MKLNNSSTEFYFECDSSENLQNGTLQNRFNYRGRQRQRNDQWQHLDNNIAIFTIICMFNFLLVNLFFKKQFSKFLSKIVNLLFSCLSPMFKIVIYCLLVSLNKLILIRSMLSTKVRSIVLWKKKIHWKCYQN